MTKHAKLAAMLAVGFGLVAGQIAPATAETLKIGVIAPLTGPAAAWGKSADIGIKFLASEINAKGGLDVGGKKYQIEVVTYDDQYKASEALAAYNRLATQDGVKYFVESTSPTTIALTPVVENDKNILIAAAGVEKAVPPTSRNVFRILSIYRDYVPLAADWIKANKTERRLAFVEPNDDVGWSFTETASADFKSRGFDVVDTELFERSARDFVPLLTKVLSFKPEIIDISGSPPASAGLIVRQARELGFKGTFIKLSAAATKEIVDAAGKEGAEGTISLHFANFESPGYQRLAEVYQKQVGQQPDDLIVIFYDGVNSLLHAIQKAGDVNDTAKVADALVNGTFPVQSIQDVPLHNGDGKGHGDINQIMTSDYLSVIKDGKPAVVGRLQF